MHNRSNAIQVDVLHFSLFDFFFRGKGKINANMLNSESKIQNRKEVNPVTEHLKYITYSPLPPSPLSQTEMYAHKLFPKIAYNYFLHLNGPK